MKKIVLYGAGGFARETAFLIERINRAEPTYELAGFIVDDEYGQQGQTIHGIPVVGNAEWLIEHKDEVVCTCAIGQPAARKKIQTELEKQGVKFETLISPDVDVHFSNRIGNGTVIGRGVNLYVDVSIGDGVVINGRCGIGHDAVIEDYACIMGACSVNGYAHIGEEAFLGSNCCIIPHKKVGKGAVVAAGSVVFTNVKAGTHVIGNPAKKIDL